MPVSFLLWGNFCNQVVRYAGEGGESLAERIHQEQPGIGCFVKVKVMLNSPQKTTKNTRALVSAVCRRGRFSAGRLARGSRYEAAAATGWRAAEVGQLVVTDRGRKGRIRRWDQQNVTFFKEYTPRSVT